MRTDDAAEVIGEVDDKVEEDEDIADEVLEVGEILQGGWVGVV